MLITTKGYNIAHVVLPTAISPNVKTKVGDTDDFNILYNTIRCSGIIRVTATIGDQYMDGAMLSNGWQNADGIECFAISMAGSDFPYIVQAEITLEDGDCYVMVTITTLT